nr:NUDIX domain-containing protein [Vibrio campbellii]
MSYPNYWDLPGGGREGNETPEDCALRELKENSGSNCAHRVFITSKK